MSSARQKARGEGKPLRDPKIWNLALAGLLAATVYFPASLVFENPVLFLMALIVPIFSAAPC
jgi:hypothetical protein